MSDQSGNSGGHVQHEGEVSASTLRFIAERGYRCRSRSRSIWHGVVEPAEEWRQGFTRWLGVVIQEVTADLPSRSAWSATRPLVSQVQEEARRKRMQASDVIWPSTADGEAQDLPRMLAASPAQCVCKSGQGQTQQLSVCWVNCGRRQTGRQSSKAFRGGLALTELECRATSHLSWIMACW